METMLSKLVEECRPCARQGKVASYIPALAQADPEALGIYILDRDGLYSRAGDSCRRFTVQSVIKPILLLQALIDNGEETVRARVGVEATGKPFDAINVTDQELVNDHLNPMVNMGAILMCTLIRGRDYGERFQRLLELTRTLAGDPDIGFSQEVYASERGTGSKNRALAFLLKSQGLLEDDVEEVLDCYFRACAIEMDCRGLARVASALANHGRTFPGGERLFPPRYARYVNAVLMTCGMYDGSGDFAVRVGVPAKSGVGGGIMAVVPGRMGIGIYAPALDRKGNSLAGIQILTRLSERLDLSIF